METKNMKLAEVRLTYKSKVKASERPQINQSQDVHRLLWENWNFEIIEFIEMTDKSPPPKYFSPTPTPQHPST